MVLQKKDIWTAVDGEEFQCRREGRNQFNPFAVAVMRGGTIIGHVPRKISSVCSLFLHRGGSITCRVTGDRRYSGDLVQGGLEVRCVLRFEGDDKLIAKAKKLIESALTTETIDLLASKKRKINSPLVIQLDGIGGSTNSTGYSTKYWVQQGGIVLTTTDKEHILSEKKLNDLHINLAQTIKQQFSDLVGLKSTLLQTRKHPVEEKKEQIQIVHSRGDHWIVASSIHAAGNEVLVLVYDSIY